MTLAEVHGLGCHHDPHTVRWKDHIVAARARAIAAIRAADAPSSRRLRRVVRTSSCLHGETPCCSSMERRSQIRRQRAIWGRTPVTPFGRLRSRVEVTPPATTESLASNLLIPPYEMRPSTVRRSLVRAALTLRMISMPRAMSSADIEGAPPSRATCSGT